MFRWFGWVKPSEEIKQIGMDMINNPDNWISEYYNFSNKDGSIFFWTANGLGFLTMNRITIPMVDRIYINNCMKKSIANRILNTIKGSETTETTNIKCIED